MSSYTILCYVKDVIYPAGEATRLKDKIANEPMWGEALTFLDSETWDASKNYEYKNMGDPTNEKREELTKATVEQILANIDTVSPIVVGQIDGEWWIASDYTDPEPTRETDEFFAAYYLADDQETLPSDGSDQLDYLNSLSQRFVPCVLIRGDEGSGETGSGWLADLGG